MSTLPIRELVPLAVNAPCTIAVPNVCIVPDMTTLPIRELVPVTISCSSAVMLNAVTLPLNMVSRLTIKLP